MALVLLCDYVTMFVGVVMHWLISLLPPCNLLSCYGHSQTLLHLQHVCNATTQWLVIVTTMFSTHMAADTGEQYLVPTWLWLAQAKPLSQ